MSTVSSITNNTIDLDAIYGQTPTPTETPSLIQESMKSFREILEMDRKENSKWRLAEERCPSECRDDFKLIFLRCEVFRINLAVKRYIRYWDNRYEVFGHNAFLPIMDLGPNGAMKDSMKEVRWGYARATPNGQCQDPDGRVVCFVDGLKLDSISSDITMEGLVRASWYQVHFGLLSESAQRKGFVVVYRPVRSISALAKSPSKALSVSVRGALPVRLAAIHIIDPPAVASVVLKLARHFVGKAIQKRIYIHNHGSFEKNLESLSKFGLGRKQLPNDMGGEFVFEEMEW